MTILASLQTAFKGLKVNKRRTLLTMLGIIIGIASVIIIMAVGAGAQSLILNQIESIGSNLIGVFPGASEEEGPPVSVMGITITTLKYEDAEALRDKNKVPHLTGVLPYVRGVDTVSWGARKTDSTFVGTGVDYLEVENGKMEQGRFFTKEEEGNFSRVAVLGSQVKENLFREAEAVGEKIKIKKQSFSVIGVLEPKGVSGFINQDDQIYIPVKTAQKMLLGVNHLSFVRTKVDAADNVPQTIADIKAVLREQHNITDPRDDDFTVRSQMEAMETFLSVTDGLRYFLAAIAALSLLVGGIGIMNIMLVTVTERTREIGLRKAVGALHADVLKQFLVEAAAVTFTGGVFGIIGGSLFAALVALGVNYAGYDWDLVITPTAILLATGVSVAVGLIFGFYPAWRAAGMDPVAALRYE